MKEKKRKERKQGSARSSYRAMGVGRHDPLILSKSDKSCTRRHAWYESPTSVCAQDQMCGLAGDKLVAVASTQGRTRI